MRRHPDSYLARRGLGQLNHGPEHRLVFGLEVPDLLAQIILVRRDDEQVEAPGALGRRLDVVEDDCVLVEANNLGRAGDVRVEGRSGDVVEGVLGEVEGRKVRVSIAE